MRTAGRGARLLAALAVSTGAITVATGATPAHATVWTISLSASQTSVPVGATVTLTATTNQDPGFTPYYFEVFDIGTHERVCYGGGGLECSTDVSQSSAGSHNYRAYIADGSGNYPPSGVQASSNIVTVTWTQPVGTGQIALTAVPPVAFAGGTVQLVAAGSHTGTPTSIEIVDVATGTDVKYCALASTCSVAVTQSTEGIRRYLAYLEPNTYSGAATALATSATLPVAWVDPSAPPANGLPSSSCDAGTPLLDTTLEGVHTKLYVLQPSAQETDVCVRAEIGSTGIGGEFVVRAALPVPGIGLPSTDTQASKCTTTTPNLVPGFHPIESGTVAGQTVLLDAYANASAVWVCARVGTTAERVILPVGLPGLPDPATLVTFEPDPL